MLPMARDQWIPIFLFVLSLLVFTHGLSIHGIESRDDEILYFQSTQEMLTQHDFLSPTYFGEDRFQKPILYYWLILLSYKILGVNWFAARFVAVLFAGLTVLLTWIMAKKFFDSKTATLSALILMTIPLFFRHAKDAVPDMPLTFFIVLAMFAAIKFFEDPACIKYQRLFFVACGLGFMIKGFAALVIPWATVMTYAFWTKQTNTFKKIRFWEGLGILAIIILPWFLYMIKIHGNDYLHYMFVEETKNRLVDLGANHFFYTKGKEFFVNSLFYLKVILSYFSPWSIFFLAAVPFVILKKKYSGKEAWGLQWLLSWMGVVFLFFASLHVVMNHYLMALTVPFAILLSRAFLAPLPENDRGQVVTFFRKYGIVFILGLGFFAFAFMVIFMVGASAGWLIFFLLIYIFSVVIIQRSSQAITAPFILSIFLILFCFQTDLLNKTRMVPQRTLENFARTIHQDMHGKKALIGVGSHDLHEQEFQVYFGQPLVKIATSEELETQLRLREFFRTPEKAYCLLLEKDFENHLKYFYPGGLKILREDDMARKRIALDDQFFMALLKLDQKKVYEYLMERVVLVKKDDDSHPAF